MEAQEVMQDEAQRRLKEAINHKQNASELNDMDIKNIKVNAERQAIERLQQAQNLEHEKETL